MRVQTAAAVGGKVLHILGVLAVPHSAVGVVGLAGCSVQHQIVRHVLVHEALTVQVHLQERLAAHPEQRAIAGLAVLAGLVRLDGTAVKDHGGVGLVHDGTGPQAGLDTVALGTGLGIVDAGLLHTLGLQGVHHGFIAAVAAAGQNDALGCVVAHILVVGILGDQAGDTVAVLFQLDHGDLVLHFQPVGLGVLEHGVHGQLLAVLVAVLGAVAHVQHLVVVVVMLFVDLVAEVDAALGQYVGEPVDGLTAAVCPHLCQAAAGIALAPIAQVAHSVLLVHVIAVLLLLLGAAGSQRVADAAGHVVAELFDQDGLGTGLGRGGSGKGTRRTSTHHQHLTLHGLLDVALGHFGLLAQPVGGGGSLLGGLLSGVDGTAAGLTDAVGHSVLHSLAGHGGTGHTVDLAGLSVHHLLDQLVLGGLADAVGLAGQVQLHLGDAGSVKGHRGGDLAHALGGGSVGAGGVDAGCTGGCSSGGAAGCIAGSQTGCGDAAHGSGCCDFQKAFAGDLFHNKVPFSSFSSCFVPEWQKCFAILVKSITFTTKEKEVIISL